MERRNGREEGVHGSQLVLTKPWGRIKWETKLEKQEQRPDLRRSVY